MSNFMGVSWWIWGFLACGVSLLYVFLIPNQETVMAASGVKFFILRWLHSVIWIFLAASFFMRASGNEMLINWANPLAMLGGIGYAIYLFTMVRG